MPSRSRLIEATVDTKRWRRLPKPKMVRWRIWPLLAGVAVAIPAFHRVNDVDLQGMQCPLPNARGVPCNTLCVRDREDCPDQVQLNCKRGEHPCLDGICRKSCEGITNICACKANTREDFVPCAAKPELTVDIAGLNRTSKRTMVAAACGDLLDIDPELGTWTLDPEDDMFWAGCPLEDPPAFTFAEPMWLTLFSVIGGELALLALWSVFKSVKEKGVRPMYASDESASASKDEKEVRMQEVFPIKGFVDCAGGTAMVHSLLVISVGWLCYLGVITADYYGAVNGKEYGIAYGSYDLSSSMFIALWVLATAWFVTLNVARSRVRNYFRLQVDPNDAEYVQIEQIHATTLMLDDGNDLLRRVRSVEARFQRMMGWDVLVATARLRRTANGLLYFNHRCQRYVLLEGGFQPYAFELGSTHAALCCLDGGLTDEEATRRLELKGPNFIEVRVPTFPAAFAEEMTGFFYLYQLMIMWLFYYLAYWVIGVVDTVVIFASAVVKVMVRLRAEHRVKAMAEHQEKVRVLRNGQWTRISSRSLVPGDVFEVANHSTVPCDAVLLQGCAVADESSLTGEPLPIRKFPLRPELVPFDRLGADKIHALFAGTTIKQTMGDDVRALVCLTATDTDKGQLVHKILFPNPISFIFDEQLKVVVMVLAVWGLALFCIAMWLMNKGGSAAWFYGMFCLAQILSPILPASLVVGQSVAAKELEKKHVHCVDLPRIMIAGKIQIFCFDKTGTLTKEGLEFYGGQTVVDRQLSALQQDAFPDMFQLALSTCHSVTRVGEQLIGNPVDIEMFTATNWTLQPPQLPEYIDTIHGPDRIAHILRRFEFVHARASMSVAVLDEATGHVHVFIKGSFEKMAAIASRLPDDYAAATTRLAAEGCYVLAVAHRDLGQVTKQQVDAMSREEMEGGANLMGLVVFKNQLKEDTRASILELKRGNTRTVMITGDTALTGIYIARTSGMMSEQAQVYLGDLDASGEVTWVDAKHLATGEPDAPISTGAVRSMFPKDGLDSPVELAVTGRAFNRLVQNDEMRGLLLNVRVFSRMLPHDKVQCIQLHMERGITAMCGDGGNDCGALRAAHVGIALSEAEASIVAAFSSSKRTVASCVELLRQGRAALATSFANYKFLILYGETMAFLKLHTFYFSVSPSQNLWILVDAVITVGLTFAITQSRAADRLSASRPTARLLGPETLASALGQIFINAGFLMGAFGLLFRQPFFKCNEFDASVVDLSKWYLLGDNFESSLLSFLVLFHFVNSAFVFNLGYKFRAAFYRNYLLIFIWGSFILLIMYVLLADPNWIGCALRLNCGDADVIESLGFPRPTFAIVKYNIPHGHNIFPTPFRYLLAGYCVANMATGILWETLVVLGPVRRWARRNKPLPRLTVKL